VCVYFIIKQFECSSYSISVSGLGWSVDHVLHFNIIMSVKCVFLKFGWGVLPGCGSLPLECVPDRNTSLFIYFNKEVFRVEHVGGNHFLGSFLPRYCLVLCTVEVLVAFFFCVVSQRMWNVELVHYRRRSLLAGHARDS
jgi:hypothetical protein